MILEKIHGFPPKPTFSWIFMDSHGFLWILVGIHRNRWFPLGTAVNPAIGDVSDTRWWCSERFCAHWWAICARITPYWPPQDPLDPPKNQLFGPQPDWESGAGQHPPHLLLGGGGGLAGPRFPGMPECKKLASRGVQGILGRQVWSDPSTDSSPMSAETLRTPPARVGNVADCRI